ncbi:hypothetical protein ACIQJX_38055 [Streptomyces griseoviridis]|uniref:hypothetical protein n=1 Tax=Streptomyces griseoviridis TaxID=45398 RepID=UPI00344ABA5C
MAAESAGRAAGYCWLEHPDGARFCTLPPGHDGDQHVDKFRGRESLTAATGTAWPERLD